jgi:hypothetical protein
MFAPLPWNAGASDLEGVTGGGGGGGCEGADHGNLQKFPHRKINTFSVLSRPLTLVLHFHFLPTHLP